MSSANINTRTGALEAFGRMVDHYKTYSKRANWALFDIRVKVRNSRGRTTAIEVSYDGDRRQWLVYDTTANKLRFVANPVKFMQSYTRTPGRVITKIQLGYDGHIRASSNSNRKSPARK